MRFIVKIAMPFMWDKHAGNFPAEYLNNEIQKDCIIPMQQCLKISLDLW